MTMQSLGRPTLSLDFRHAIQFPPRLTFARAGTLTYRNALGATLTAQANSPRVGLHPTDDTLPPGLVLAATETCVLTDTVLWLRAAKGTMLWVGVLRSVAPSTILWGMNDGTADNVFRLRMSSSVAGRLQLSGTTAGVTQATTTVIDPMIVGQRYAIAVAWDGGDIKTMVNDRIQASAALADGVAGSLNVLSVGSVITSLAGAVMDGVIERVAYWPKQASLGEMRTIAA